MAQSGRSLYLRVGTLVVIGAALAVGFILFLTSGRFGGRQMVFETYVRESVAGLDVGAPMRFRGVPVGRVTELGLATVIYGSEDGGGVDNTANRLVVIRFAVDPERYGHTPVEDAVRAGLRVRISSTGVTGVSFLEADFVDPRRYPPITVPWTPAFPYVPSVPSTITQVTSAAERLMTRLADVNIEALFNSATSLLDELRGQVGSQGDLGVTLREAAATMTTLRETIEGAALGDTVREIRNAATRIAGAGEAAEQLLQGPELTAAIADLRTALGRLPAVIQALEATLRTVRGTTGDAQADLGPLLRDLRATVSSLRDTAEQLRRSPSQSLFGQPPPPPSRDRR